MSESTSASDMCSASVYGPTDGSATALKSWLTFLDGFDSDQEGDGNRLPEGEEEDTLDAEEFGYQPSDPCSTAVNRTHVKAGTA